MNLFYQPDVGEKNFLLSEEESRHAIKVLRCQVGDQLNLTDGRGNLYRCVIQSIVSNFCSMQIVHVETNATPKYYIHIAMAPTKNAERTEWFVEKATELGIQEISFLRTQRSERPRVNLDRMERIAISALKQSGQVWLPKINDMIDFNSILSTPADQKFIAHVDVHVNGHAPHLFNQALKEKSYLTLVGPEGDFTQTEISAAIKIGIAPISLGVNVLRTETAAMAACHILNLLNS